MQGAITFMAVLGGLAFSLIVALAAEELIFGQVIRLFFLRTSTVQTCSLGTSNVRGSDAQPKDT